MDNPQECNICFTAFDDSEHRPRTLPCGHTYCSPCIGGLMDDGLLCCPSCRAHHPVTQVSQFPISYTIEAFVKKMKSDGAQQTRSPRKWASLSKSAVAGSSTQRGVKRKLESLLDEEKSSIITMTTLWKDVNSQLDEYDGQLNDWELEHNSLLGQLNKLEKRQFHAMRLLRKEKTKLQNIKKDGNEALKQLENVQKMINTIKKPHEYITAIENADNCSEIVERWYQTCQENFPDVETITFTKKIQEITKAATAALAAAETAYNERVYPTAIPADPSSSIMQRIKMYTTPLKQMTIEELFTMEQPTRRLVEDGKVFGIQKIGDQLRSSRLTLENDKLFLHCLLDKPPPLDTHTIQVANLMQTAIEESTLVFLELCWGGSSRGRVYIRLELDTSLGRQFSQLCTGLHGQSYRNTSFIQVCDKGENGAYMVGGDYEFNNGEGGAPVVTHSNEERYRSSTKAGVLGALWEPRSKRSAQFFITTRGNRRDSEEERRDDGRSNYDHDYDDRERRHERRRRGNDERNKKGRCWRVYGRVERGLEIVRSAVSIQDITQVSVVDCGIMVQDFPQPPPVPPPEDTPPQVRSPSRSPTPMTPSSGGSQYPESHSRSSSPLTDSQSIEYSSRSRSRSLSRSRSRSLSRSRSRSLSRSRSRSRSRSQTPQSGSARRRRRIRRIDSRESSEVVTYSPEYGEAYDFDVWESHIYRY